MDTLEEGGCGGRRESKRGWWVGIDRENACAACVCGWVRDCVLVCMSVYVLYVGGNSGGHVACGMCM